MVKVKVENINTNDLPQGLVTAVLSIVMVKGVNLNDIHIAIDGGLKIHHPELCKNVMFEYNKQAGYIHITGDGETSIHISEKN